MSETDYRRIGVRSLQLVAVLIAGSILAVLLLRWIPPATTAVMMERRAGAFLHDRKYQNEHRWVPWNRIAPAAALAAIAAEDQNFENHHGFDFKSIQKAIDAHDRGRRLRGASTISQQVSKNLFLWPGRSFIRKGFEAYFTVLLELIWPKRRILEMYLNVVEFGDGIFGIEAASQHYFRKPAASLSLEEAARLAAVLPNPIRLKAGRPSDYVQERTAWIVRQMGQLGGTALIKRF